MSTPRFLGRFACPHCGFGIERWFGLHERLQVVTCPLDAGGCDQDFAVEPNVQVFVNPQVYRIEGIGHPVDRSQPEEDTGW